MLRPLRSEVSGTMNYGEDNQILSIKYSPSGAEIGPGQLNMEDLTYNTPFLIKWYRATIVCDFMGVVYQTYGDSDDETNLSNWDGTNEEFYTALKKFRFTSKASNVTYLSFASKWNKKARKWRIPPIKMGTRNAGGNFVNISIANRQIDSADTKYFAVVEAGIHRLD